MKNENQLGQTLIENIIANLILFLCAFSVIEISRLLAFKSYLQVLAEDTVRQIAFSQLTLIRDVVISESQKRNKIQKNEFKRKIKKDIEKKLELFQTSLFSFDNRGSKQSQEFLYLNDHQVALQVEFIQAKKSNVDSKNAPGVYLKINSCLPVLFSGYFRIFSDRNKEIPQIGKTINDKSSSTSESLRNCLGYYPSSNVLAPLFWFRVRTAAYFPWPASTSIYEKGFAFPDHIFGIEDKYREDVFHALEKFDLNLFFNEIK